MRQGRYTYQGLGVLFIAFLVSLWLAHRFGWGWYFLTFASGAHCFRGAAYTFPAGQDLPTGPLSWMGWIIHKVLHRISLLLEILQIRFAMKMVRFLGGRAGEGSFWKGSSPELQDELVKLEFKLLRKGELTDFEIAEANDLRRELISQGVPDRKLESTAKIVEKLSDGPPDAAQMTRMWPFVSVMYAAAFCFIQFVMTLTRVLDPRQHDATDISRARNLPIPVSIGRHRAAGYIRASFDDIKAVPTTEIGWNPALLTLQQDALCHLLDAQYGRVLSASLAADKILEEICGEVLVGAPAAAREDYIRNVEFWVGAKLLAMRLGRRPSLMQLRTIYEGLVRFKAVEIDLHAVRHRIVQSAPAKSRDLWKRMKPSLEERIKVESQAFAKRDLRRFRLRLRETAADLYLGLAVHMGIATREIEQVRWSRIREGIPKDALFLDIYRYRPVDMEILQDEEIGEYDADRYFLFAVRNGEIEYRDIGAVAPIDELLLTHLQHLSGHQYDVFGRAVMVPTGIHPSATDEAWIVSGKALADLILLPLGGMARDISRLFVSSDGYFSRVPFETFSSDGQTILLDSCTVSYIDSARDFGRTEPELTDNVEPPVVVGAPNFDFGLKAACAGFDALEGTEAEAQSIAALVGVNALTGDEALKETIIGVSGPSVLHLATHGYYVPPAAEEEMECGVTPATVWDRFDALARIGSPLVRSGMALSGANTWLCGKRPPPSAGNGLLSAEDVLGMNLAGTQLVVLSACETGLGEPRPGEGVFGLRRTFFIAGSRSVVSSLWSVPDQATSALMTCFYKNLLAGRDKAEALRAAQLTLRHTYPEPVDWAGFICMGDTSRVRFV